MPTCAFTQRRRAESNRRTGLCSGKIGVHNGSPLYRIPGQSAYEFGPIQPDSWRMRHQSAIDIGCRGREVLCHSQKRQVAVHQPRGEAVSRRVVGHQSEGFAQVDFATAP